MIGRIKRRLIASIMIAVSVVLMVILCAMNVMNYIHMTSNADDMLSLIAENNGTLPEYETQILERRQLPEQLSRESQFQTRYFIVQYDNNDNIIDINLSHIAAVSDVEAKQYADSVLDDRDGKGFKGIYRYRIKNMDFGRIVIFLDCRLVIQSTASTIITSYTIGAICLIAIFFAVVIFSSRFIKPLVDNMEKQKQFITDAGHELKTPLAIINANVEVMELMNGSNEWLDSVKNQVKRLDKLVKGLLQLAKMEEGSMMNVMVVFDMSKAFEEITEPFKVVAQQKEISLRINCEKNIKMYGEESSIRNLISILVDNAIKYTNDKGTIDARLSKEGKSIRLVVKNSSDVDPSENLDRLFDRFYRADTSRSRESGGFGIGLSMAKNIVDTHGGRISAHRDGEYVVFSVVLKSATAAQIKKGRMEKQDGK